MHIAVVGATGPTGLLVVRQALGRGHQVTAYVRRPGALAEQAGLRVIVGELSDTAEFAAAISGCDALISTLGTRKLSERNFMTVHLPMVTSAMQQAGISRLVLMSALGGGDVPTHLGAVSRAIFKVSSRTMFVDRTRSEVALKATGMRWSAVYPGFLTDKPALVDVDQVEAADLRSARGGAIPRANVASLLVDLAENPLADGRRVYIGAPGTLKSVR